MVVPLSPVALPNESGLDSPPSLNVTDASSVASAAIPVQRVQSGLDALGVDVIDDAEDENRAVVEMFSVEAALKARRFAWHWPLVTHRSTDRPSDRESF